MNSPFESNRGVRYRWRWRAQSREACRWEAWNRGWRTNRSRMTHRSRLVAT